MKFNCTGKIFLKIFLFLILCFTLVSCIEIKKQITVNKDGTGEARMEIGIMAQFANEMLPKIKAEVPGGWVIVEEKQRDGKHFIVFGRKFTTISDLNDKNNEYAFTVEKKGFMQNTYMVTVTYKESISMPGTRPPSGTMEQPPSPDGQREEPGTVPLQPPQEPSRQPQHQPTSLQMQTSPAPQFPFQQGPSQPPFTLPFVIVIKMPGEIYETNGTRISSNEAQWALQSLKPGAVLTVKSKDTLFPTTLLVYGGIVLGGIILLAVIIILLSRKGRKSRHVAPGTSQQTWQTPSAPPGTGARGHFCTQCGRENKPEANFCVGCGAKIG